MPSFLQQQRVQQQRVQQQRQRRYDRSIKQCVPGMSPGHGRQASPSRPQQPMVIPTPWQRPQHHNKRKHGLPTHVITHPCSQHPCLPATSGSHPIGRTTCIERRLSSHASQPAAVNHRTAQHPHAPVICIHPPVVESRPCHAAAPPSSMQRSPPQLACVQARVCLSGWKPVLPAPGVVHTPPTPQVVQPSRKRPLQMSAQPPMLDPSLALEWAGPSLPSSPPQPRLTAVPETHTPWAGEHLPTHQPPRSAGGHPSQLSCMATHTAPTGPAPALIPPPECPVSMLNHVHASLSQIQTSVTLISLPPDEARPSHTAALCEHGHRLQHPPADSPTMSLFSRARHPLNQAWAQHSQQLVHSPNRASSAASSPSRHPSGWDRGFFCSRQSQQGHSPGRGSVRSSGGRLSNTWG